MKRALVISILASVLGAGWLLHARSLHSRLPVAQKRLHPAYDPDRLTRTITFYEVRVKENAQAGIEAAMLADLYNQRYRQTGDMADALRAEKMARRSLAIRATRNEAAQIALARSCYTQHRFTEARKITEKVLAQGENQPARALQIEAYLELGDYETAAQALRHAGGLDREPTGMALRARLLEINGQPEQALAVLIEAKERADLRYDTPLESLAWFWMRIGDVQAGMGRVAEAQCSYQESLDRFPSDHRVLTAMARLASARQDWKEAIRRAQQAAEVVPTPELAALMADAWDELGGRRQAEAQEQMLEAMSKLARAHGTTYDRQRALYLADHDRNLKESLTLARQELKVRHDIYAWDTLAWACYKNQLLTEAERAMEKAMARGTRDARLFYHAGMIAEARGQKERADMLLSRAFAVNPWFHPAAPQQVRKVLAQ